MRKNLADQANEMNRRRPKNIAARPEAGEAFASSGLLAVRRFMAALALVWLPVLYPSMLAAEAVAKNEPVYGSFSESSFKGKAGYEIYFSAKMVADKEIIFKSLAEDERPFRFSRPIDFKVFWRSDKVLRLEPRLSEREFEDALDKKALDLIWKKDFKSKDGRPLKSIAPASENMRFQMPALVFNSAHKNKSGELYNRLNLKPFAVDVKPAGNDGRVSLQISFNRLMAESDELGKALNLESAPVDLKPALPLKGSWKNQRTLAFSQSFTRNEFWDQVSDVPFTLSWKPGVKNLHGQALPSNFAQPSKFFFSKFAQVGFDQAGMNLDGWADYDLAFNKPVNLADLKKSLVIKKYVYQNGSTLLKTSSEKSTGFENAEFEVTEAPENYNQDGTVLRVKVKAEHGERLSAAVSGLRSADGRGLIVKASDGGWVDSFFTISNTHFNVEENYPWRSYFTIDTHEPVRFDGIEKYIVLDPPLDFTVSPYGQEGHSIQIFAPFRADENTKVTLKRGLPSQRGVLTRDMEYLVSVPENSDRKLMFTGRGRYLSPDQALLVKLAGRNVKKVRLQAWRVYESNLAAIINIQDYDQNVRLRLAQQFSDNLLDRESETKALPGQTFERLIKLDGLLGERPKGAYILKCSPVKDEGGESEDEYDAYYSDSYYDYADYYYHTERYLPVMISDIGLSAHTLPGEVAVWANSLSQAKPIRGGLVKFYDQANQVVAEGRTNDDGLFSSAVNPSQLVFVTVEKDGDLNYLTLGRSARSTDDDDYWGEDAYYERRQWQENGNAKWYGGDGGYLPVASAESPFGPMRGYLLKGYEAFLFMPRDMFKPGENVTVKAIVRDKNIMPPAAAFPVLWRIDDPDGRSISHGQAEMNAQGGLDFSAPIPFSARTGSYSAAIFLPGSAQALGRVKFVVEDFVPPRLALDVKADQKIYVGGNPEIKIEADIKYLFGAPGANLNWELDAVVFPSGFAPAGWDDFDFSSAESGFQTTRQSGVAKGRLDELGRALVQYSPGIDSERLPNKTSIEFVFSAQEDGGRWNAKKARVDYFPRNLILGTRSARSPLVKKPFAFEVAAVTPSGQAAETPELAVSVFQVKTRYYNSYRYGRHYRQAAEELVEKSVSQLALKDGRGELSYTPESAGVYEFHVNDEQSGQLIKRRVRVYGLDSEVEALSARAPVEISFDRESYLPGQTARLKIKSPFPGRLWLTAETAEIRHSAAYDLPGRELEVEIPVKDIRTNAHVSATVVRALDDRNMVVRAVGTASLEIDRSIYKLNVSAELPERIKPSKPSRLKIKVLDNLGRPVRGEATVALVDEGVLSLSNFKTPEPWKLFVAGRSLMTRFYDLYDQLLPLEREALPFLSPGGGDGLGRSGLFSPFKRNQEILSIFLPAIALDANGEAEIDLDIPEYSGQGRLMVVAAGGDKFGSAARSIRISRDLTAEATLPLALAPGDRFEIPIRMFLAAEAPGAAGRPAEILCRTEGPLKILGEASAQLDLEPGQGRNVIFQARAEADGPGAEQAGVGRLIIEAADGVGESFRQSLEVVVRPPYPRVSQSIGAQVETAETDLVIDTAGFLPGTVEASITLAKSPAVEAVRAVRWLQSYPYGCLEQTTSKAWAFVGAEDILRGLETEENADRHLFNGLNQAVQRLTTMQTVNGGFASWPGGNQVYDWGSVYAAHFLTEADKHMELPKNLLERSLDWLQAYLGSSYGDSTEEASYILSTKAYALYVLALHGRFENGWYNSLKDRYDGLNPSARIFLAGAQALRDGHSKALMELEGKVDLSYNNLSARASSLDSGPRNMALKLLVWAEVDPLNETSQALARAVADQGRLNLWRNTQENGLAVLALGKYLSKSGLGLDYKAVLSGPEGQVIFKAGPADTASAGPGVLAGFLDKKLSLAITGEGRPYYTLTIGGVPLTPPAPKAEKIKLTRSWLIGEKKIPLSETADLAEAVTLDKGERVTVEIEVDTPEALQNMVLVDILPGGLEIENPRLVSPADEDEADSELPREQSHLEMREDRLVIIEPWVGRGRSLYRYRLRAVTCGEFVLPGTMAEGMYEPDKQAILPAGRVRVR